MVKNAILDTYYKHERKTGKAVVIKETNPNRQKAAKKCHEKQIKKLKESILSCQGHEDASIRTTKNFINKTEKMPKFDIKMNLDQGRLDHHKCYDLLALCSEGGQSTTAKSSI